MKILFIVNESPWGGSLAATAQRLARAVLLEGHQVSAVFFREEGVYHALPGRACDAGATDLTRAWLKLSDMEKFPLLLCSSASQRRLEEPPVTGFREAGLVEVLVSMGDCERVVTF